MRSSSPLSIILTTLLVVAFGWGSMYIVIKGIEVATPSTIIVKTTSQKAAVVEAPPSSSDAEPSDPNEVVPAVIPTASIPEPSIKTIPQTKSTGTQDELTIMVGGDIMFDRGIRAIGERNGYDTLFDDSIKSLFKKADILAANLEGPITSYPSKTLVNGKITETLTFTFSPKIRTVLKDLGFTIVSLANNHMDNFGFLGFMETQDWLQDAGISWFGNPWNSTSTKMSREKVSDTKSPIATVMTKNGITIAFVGYHSFQLGIDKVISEIKRVSGPKVFTIVMPHWGEEYSAEPSERMKSQARAFVNAGADAVIGAHPHVVMSQEWIGDVPVYYSVGNLLFDQYFSPEVMKGNVVEMHIVQDDSGPHLDTVKVHEVNLKSGKGVKLE